MRTPNLHVDWNKAQKNAQKMLGKCQVLGVQLRPHVKTHKSVELAYMQCGNRFGPITVSTMSELFFFYENGFNTILYAVPISPKKLEELRAICQTDAEISVCFDSLSMTKSFVSIVEFWLRKPSIYLEVDPGYNRCGFDISDSDFAEAVHILTENKIPVCAVMAHSGHSYVGKSPAEIDEIAYLEAEILNEAANCVYDISGIRPKTSAGSTPTSILSEHWKSCNEIRPGNYVMFDLFMRDLGVCNTEDIACSVKTSVLSIYPDRGEMVVDAGALAMSKDSGHPHGSHGFGQCLEFPELYLAKISQEHGTVKADSTTLSKFSVGDEISFLPNHSCLTLACHSKFIVDNNSDLTQIKPCREW